MFELTGAAEAIWRALLEGATVPELVAALTGEYDVDATVAAADTMRFLEDRDTHQLLAPPE